MRRHTPPTITGPTVSSPDPHGQQQVRQRLRDQLLTLSFHAFEQCVRDLLTTMGYSQVSVLDRVTWRQRTSHGGLDMQASAQTGVTRSRIILQLKQYERPVSRRFIDELRGAMLRVGAGQGLLITTSTFSRAARKAAASDQLVPVRLVDGEELLDLLWAYGVGVQKTMDAKPGEVIIDAAFFTDLAVRYPQPAPRHTQKAPPPDANAGVPWPGTAYFTSNLGGAHDRCRPQGGPMLWRTHVLGGISSLWLLGTIPGAITQDTIPLLVILSAFGALLPDLDAAQSKIRHLRVGGIEPLSPLAALTHRTFGHRGPLHSLAGLALFTLLGLPLSFWWGWPTWAAFTLGYASHLLLDACTRSGIPLWPGTRHRFHLLPERLRFVTGSLAEEMLLPLLAMAVLLLLFKYLPVSS